MFTCLSCSIIFVPEFDIMTLKVELDKNICLIPKWNECVLLGWTENSYIEDYE